MRLAEITIGIALDAGAVSLVALPDPMDRPLVATARALDVPLVTHDGRILEYASVTSAVRVIDAAL